MRRRGFIIVLGATLASILPDNGAAKAAADRVYRVGILETVAAEPNAANFGALRRGLQELGYVEGRNLELIYRSADGRAERFPVLAAELLASGVDLIVTRGTPAARAAKAATASVPIVMAAIGEPLGVGVVASLARPGGNVTGLSAFVTELSGKRIELLKETLPSMRRVGVLLNLGNPVSLPQWEEAQVSAAKLGLSATLFDVRSDAAVRNAFPRMAGIDALSVGIDVVTQANARLIVDLAAEHKILTAYPAREFVDIGGLLSYGPSYPDLYSRAAALIDKIFKGANPGDLPVQQPTKLELVINLRTAQALGLAVPPTLLARADEVIE